ncbi:MAG: S1C family serine protease [Hyphomicrobiaceae bacterium]
MWRSLGARICALIVASAILLPLTLAAARAQAPSLEGLVGAVVHVKTFIDPEGRTTQNLGREREGSGIVIDSSGLVLTIGYLMVEAHSAEVVTHDGNSVSANVVGYDHETGFGLLRAAGPLNVRPMPMGKSADLKAEDPVLIASFGGADMVGAARVVARREFAGSWEYLLEDAIFTAPPHPRWSGAALINREGKLVGIGSLVVGDTSGKSDGPPGNMFVPIDRLPPILAELIADGRVQGPARPWLGLTIEPLGGLLLVARVVPQSPAEKAGVQRGDVVLGVAGAKAKDLADFYRKVWARGSAGTTVPVDVMQNSATRRIDIPSMSRYDHLKLKSTF